MRCMMWVGSIGGICKNVFGKTIHFLTQFRDNLRQTNRSTHPSMIGAITPVMINAPCVHACRSTHLPTTSPRTDCPVLHHFQALPAFCAGDRRVGRTPAAVRPPGIRRVSEVRSAGTWLFACEVRRLPARTPRCIFVQAQRVLPQLRGTAHGGVGRSPGRSCLSGTAGTAVGADVSVFVEISALSEPEGSDRCARCGAPRHCNVPGQTGWVHGGLGCEDGSRHPGSAFRLGAQSEPALEHAVPGRGTRDFPS